MNKRSKLEANSDQSLMAVQRSWFARVNALRNLSRKKWRKVATVTSEPISEQALLQAVLNE